MHDTLRPDLPSIHVYPPFLCDASDGDPVDVHHAFSNLALTSTYLTDPNLNFKNKVSLRARDTNRTHASRYYYPGSITRLHQKPFYAKQFLRQKPSSAHFASEPSQTHRQVSIVPSRWSLLTFTGVCETTRIRYNGAFGAISKIFPTPFLQHLAFSSLCFCVPVPY